MVHKLLIKLINIVTSIPKCLFHPFPITYKLIQNYSNNPFDSIIFLPDRIPTNIFLLPNFFPSPFFSSLTQFTNLLLPFSSLFLFIIFIPSFSPSSAIDFSAYLLHLVCRDYVFPCQIHSSLQRIRACHLVLPGRRK